MWAADCAERVLGLFEAEAPGDTRPRDALARTRAFGRGELDVAEEIRRRFAGGAAAREVSTPAGVIDELMLDVAPVLLGDGERLFEGVRDPGLEPVEVLHSPHATHVRYRVRR